MKKSIFLFFAAILCAMTANAQWYLMGTVTDWSSGKQMTGDSKVVSVTINLKANTNYELKIKNGSSWYGNGGTMSSTNNLAWEFSTSNNSNAKITTKDAGDYTFTWYISDKKLSVTYPNHNYIVAGDGDVMEDDWSPSSTKNKMVKQDDGTYRLTKTNRSLTAKTYGYKLTVGSWSVNQYPKDNVSLKVTAAGNYNVIFTYNPKNGQLSHELVPIYTITTSANPATAGTITGAGTYAKDASVTLEATPNAGYKFVNWTVSGVEKSTDAKYSFTASADVTAVANFELSDPEVPTYAISVSANDDAMGTVTGAGDYTEGSPVTLTATPKAGYRFVNWTVGSEVKSTETTYSFTASEALTIVANFEAIPKYDITVKAVVPEAWTSATIGIHYWGDGISGTSTPVATEKEGNWNKYTIKDVLEGQSVNVIFLNGTSWGSDKSKQTANITGITEDKCFQISAKTLDGEGKCTFTEVDCAADIKPEGDVYTIMGAGELGLSWDLAKTGNDMTKQADGTYTLVKEGLDLATTGSYEYKVVKNHSWDWSIPSGNTNQTLKVDKDGTYTITFTLSADKKKLTADALCTAEKEVILDCFVAGTINLVGGTSDFTDKLAMTYDEGTKTYSKTFTALAAGNYQMKVVYGSDWLGYDKLTKPVPANVTEGDDKKIQFTLAEAGDVTVTYNVEEGIGLVGTFAVPETKYYIAGTQNLTGFDWKENGLQLTKADDLYKHTFSALAAGTYEFKITDGTWTKTWGFGNLGAAYEEVSEGKDGEGNPNGNIKFVTEEAKNITVIFDPATGKVTLDGLTEKAPAVITYQLKGVGGWSEAGIEMTENPDKAGEYKLTCQAISATDAVKVVKLADGVITDYYGNGTVKDGVEVTVNYDGDGNITLPEGTYDFYFDTNEAEKKLWIAAATGCPVTVTVEDVFGTNTYTGVEENDGVWSKEYNVGEEVTLGIDELDSELVFAYWSVGAEKIFTEEYTFTASEDVTVTAVYALPMEVTFDNMALDTESWIVEAGPDAEYSITVTLGIDVEGDHPKGFGLVDGSQIYLGEDELELVTGYFTTVDQDAPSAEAVVIAVHAEELMAFVCSMSGVPTPAVQVEVLEGVATVDNATGELTITGQWEGDDVYVVAPGFNGASYECDEAWFYVGGITVETASIIAFGPVTITVDGNDVLVEGTVMSGMTGTNYDLFVIGTLPVTPTPTPDYTRTVTAGNFGTICLPFGGTVEGAELFECVGQETGKVYIASVTELEAGVPYIFLATATELAVYSDGTTAATAGNSNGLYGTFDNETLVAAGNYILKNNELRESDGNAKVNANRAYLVMGEVPAGAPQQMPGRKYIGMSTKGENAATGLDNITNGENTVIKTIENGQLVITIDGVQYNAQGVRF